MKNEKIQSPIKIKARKVSDSNDWKRRTYLVRLPRLKKDLPTRSTFQALERGDKRQSGEVLLFGRYAEIGGTSLAPGGGQAVELDDLLNAMDSQDGDR